MEKIDVIIIAKNEKDTIEDAIKSVKDWAENIIVVDSKSSDRTAVIAEKNGARVFEHEFKDFSDQRNFALTKTTSLWIFYMDADERATREFKEEVNVKIKNADNISGFIIKRKTFYYGRDWGLTDRVQRIFRKDELRGWQGVVHESPIFEGRLETISEPILHYTHRNLEKMVEKTNEWSEYEAKLRLKSHHPKMSSLRFFRVMATGFLKSYFREGGWKNGTYGMIEAIYQAFSMFITYAKLWEMQQKK